jgi:branched-subunit amino acid ABC-type transport system permease component
VLGHELIQSCINGIILGSMIALASLGMTLIWRIGRFPNVAQGDLLTLSAYLAFSLNVTYALPIVLAGTAAMIAATFISIGIYLIVFRPLRSAPPVAPLAASIGVALALRAVVGLAWGTELHAYRVPLTRDISLQGILINPIDIYVIVAAAALVCLLSLFIYRTRMGIEVRAVADVPDLARVSGIDSARVLRVTWGMAGFVTAAAGVLLALKIALTPVLGWNLLLPMFAATTLGGVGSIPGAILGGEAIGVATQLSLMWISSTYEVAVAFVVLALVLLFRPRGLFAHS